MSASIQPIPFIAASPEEAVAQIRARLGPEAVVVNVRPLRASGIGRLWQKPMIEVLAYRPEPEPEAKPAPSAATAVAPELTQALAEFRHELDLIRQQVRRDDDAEECKDAWRVASLLQKTGVLPQHVQTILDKLKGAHGETPPPTLAAEIALLRETLESLWRPASNTEPRAPHILIGPPASGKTTCLCKWLTQASMVEGRRARVWRLDGATANMGEALSVYCEILGVPCERAWQTGDAELVEDIGFIDLPGVDWRSPLAMEDLAGRLPAAPRAHIHLVLNAAYESSLLLAQARAFSSLPIEDLILTHLDEETRWGKIWNLALGTKDPLRYLSAGLNVPGDFSPATSDLIVSRQFARK